MYEPFKKIKDAYVSSAKFLINSDPRAGLVKDVYGAVKNATTTPSSSQQVSQQSSQPNYSKQKPGIYDQSGKQIGSSSTYQTTNVNTPSAPTPRPQPQTQAPTQPSKPSYMQGEEDLAERMRKQNEERYGRGQDYTNKAYDERNRLLQESIPQLQQQFTDTQGYFKKGLDTAQQRADIQKQNVSDEFGTIQRQAAQTRKESAARTGQRFASLNTGDSFGFGSHQQAQENIESDFNRFTQENAREQQNQKFEIDSALQDYELDAQTKIDGLKQSLEQTISKIQSDITMNGFEKENAFENIMQEYENNINSIDQYMNGVYKDYSQKLAEIEQNSLSEEFMASGQPQNETDYKFFMSNYDQYQDILGDGGSSVDDLDDKGKTAASGLDILKDIRGYISADPGVTRSLNPLANRDYKSAINNMSDVIGRLRSGGAINPDEEKRFLSLLPQYLDDQDTINKKLAQLENELNIRTGGNYQASGTNPGANVSRQVRVVSPSGETGTIDQSELQQAIQNGWREA